MLSNKILDKIKEAKITPKPKWEFLLKDYLIWISGALSLAVGSISFSAALFLVRYNDWGVGKQMAGSIWKFTLLTLPYFWIICLGVFAFILYYNFKHTKKGYKYPFYAIVLGIIFLSVVFGTLFYGVGLGQAIEEIAIKRIPFYKTHLDPRFRIWNQPEKGFMMGTIDSLDEQTMHVRGLMDKEWIIKVKKGLEFKKGERIKVIGKKIKEGNFNAEEIRLFNPRARGFFK